jgi:hypothetical protein
VKWLNLWKAGFFMTKMTVDEMEEMRHRTLRPYFNWDTQIQQCQDLKEWDSERKELGFAALSILRDFFGDDFPEKALLENHKMGDYFINNVRWAKEELIWLASAISEFRSSKGFNKIDCRLRSAFPGEFDDALTNLKFAMKFGRAGYGVEFEQEVINKNGQVKRPDLKVIDLGTGEVWFVEVSRMVESDMDRLLSKLMSDITHTGFCHGKFLKFCVAVHRRIKKTEWEEISRQVVDVAKRAAMSDRLEERVDAGLITLAVAGHLDPALADWAAVRKMDINASYRPDDSPHRRVFRKILEKEKQAAAQFPTMVIIKIEDLSMYHATSMDWIVSLDKVLIQCPSIAAVLLSSYQFGGVENFLRREEEHMLIARSEGYAWGSQSILIFNRHARGAQILKEGSAKLLQEFL